MPIYILHINQSISINEWSNGLMGWPFSIPWDRCRVVCSRFVLHNDNRFGYVDHRYHAMDIDNHWDMHEYSSYSAILRARDINHLATVGCHQQYMHKHTQRISDILWRVKCEVRVKVCSMTAYRQLIGTWMTEFIDMRCIPDFARFREIATLCRRERKSCRHMYR